MEKNAADNKGYREEQKGKSWSQEKRKSDDVDGYAEEAKKKSKISFGFNKPPASVASTLKAPVKSSVKLGTLPLPKPQKKEETKVVVKPCSAFAKAFNDDEDDEEEMPPEAKMRMRNVGRETPTSCGPNSFGKTKQGFCDARSGGLSAKKTSNESKTVTKKW